MKYLLSSLTLTLIASPVFAQGNYNPHAQGLPEQSNQNRVSSWVNQAGNYLSQPVEDLGNFLYEPALNAARVGGNQQINRIQNPSARSAAGQSFNQFNPNDLSTDAGRMNQLRAQGRVAEGVARGQVHNHINQSVENQNVASWMNDSVSSFDVNSFSSEAAMNGQMVNQRMIGVNHGVAFAEGQVLNQIEDPMARAFASGVMENFDLENRLNDFISGFGDQAADQAQAASGMAGNPSGGIPTMDIGTTMMLSKNLVQAKKQNKHAQEQLKMQVESLKRQHMNSHVGTGRYEILSESLASANRNLQQEIQRGHALQQQEIELGKKLQQYGTIDQIKNMDCTANCRVEYSKMDRDATTILHNEYSNLKQTANLQGQQYAQDLAHYSKLGQNINSANGRNDLLAMSVAMQHAILQELALQRGLNIAGQKAHASSAIIGNSIKARSQLQNNKFYGIDDESADLGQKNVAAMGTLNADGTITMHQGSISPEEERSLREGITEIPKEGIAIEISSTNPHDGIVGSNRTTNPHSGIIGSNSTTNPHAGIVGGNPTTNPHAGIVGGNRTTNPHAGIVGSNGTTNPHAGITPIANRSYTHTRDIDPILNERIDK